MKKKAVICLVLSALFLIAALFSYFYMTRSTGQLPVISYPLRAYTVPLAAIGVVLAAFGIFLHTGRRME